MKYIVKRNRSILELREGETYTFNDVIDMAFEKDYWYEWIAIPKKRIELKEGLYGVLTSNDFLEEVLRFIHKMGKLKELASYLKEKYGYVELENKDEVLMVFVDHVG